MAALHIDRVTYDISSWNSNTQANGYILDSDDGVKLEWQNGPSIGYRLPRFYLRFSDQFVYDEVDYYLRSIRHFFKSHYFCGDWNNNGGVRINVTRVTAGSHYHRSSKTIRLFQNSALASELMHELIHAIIHLRGDNHGWHPHVSGIEENVLPCAHFNVFDSGAPGLILDLKTRIQMSFKLYEFNTQNMSFDKVYLPIINEIYENTLRFCQEKYDREFGLLIQQDDDSDEDGVNDNASNGHNKHFRTDENLLGVFNDQELFDKRIKPFYESRFTDEFNYLSKRDLLPSKIKTLQKFKDYQFQKLEKEYYYSILEHLRIRRRNDRRLRKKVFKTLESLKKGK